MEIKMMAPEKLTCGDIIRGVDQDGPVEVINIKWFADKFIEFTKISSITLISCIFSSATNTTQTDQIRTWMLG